MKEIIVRRSGAETSVVLAGNKGVISSETGGAGFYMWTERERKNKN